jgi:two-component sensor histidine kinase
MHGCIRAIYRIEAEEDGPARARAIVDHELAPVVPRRTLEELELMVSELVTNGIKFGAKDKKEAVTLDLRIDDHVRCGVISRGPEFRVQDQKADPERWGLKMVADLAHRWGVQRLDERTRVWFETSRGREV